MCSGPYNHPDGSREKGALLTSFFKASPERKRGNRAFGINKRLMDEALELIRTRGTHKRAKPDVYGNRSGLGVLSKRRF